MFGEPVLQQTTGIPIGTSSRPLIHFFIQGRLHIGISQEKRKKLAPSFNFTLRFLNGVISLNNFKLGDFVDRIFLIELHRIGSFLGVLRFPPPIKLTATL